MSRYVKQAEINGTRNLNDLIKISYRSTKLVLSVEQERELQDYILRASNIYSDHLLIMSEC